MLLSTLIPRLSASLAVSFRQAAVLSAPSFRFLLTKDTLGVRLVVDHCDDNPHDGLSPSRYMPCPAHNQKVWFLWSIGNHTLKAISAVLINLIVCGVARIAINYRNKTASVSFFGWLWYIIKYNAIVLWFLIYHPNYLYQYLSSAAEWCSFAHSCQPLIYWTKMMIRYIF